MELKRFLVLNLILSCASPSFATRVNRKEAQKRKSQSMLADDAVVVKASDVDEAALQFRPPTATTKNGCKCKGNCHTSTVKALAAVGKEALHGTHKLLGKFVRNLIPKQRTDAGVCDWCVTEEACEHDWDYCEYAKQEDFDILEHAEKTDKLWSAIIDSKGTSAELPSKLGFLKGALTVSMRTPFDDWYDVLPAGRKKAIHAQAVHCKIDFDVIDNGYTGIFEKGRTTGIIRIGAATPMAIKDGNMVPGLGFKFPRSKVHSGSFVALTDASTLLGNRNFFAQSFSNHASPPDNPALMAKFGQASGCLNMVGLSDLAKYKQNGDEIDEPQFPFEIILEPKKEVKVGDDAQDADLLAALSNDLQDGDELFDVLVHATPEAKANGESVKLGTMTLASECTTSLFGDTAFFVRHQRMEEDFHLRPEWITSLNQGEDAIKKNCLNKFTDDPSEWIQPTHCNNEGDERDEEVGEDEWN